MAEQGAEILGKSGQLDRITAKIETGMREMAGSADQIMQAVGKVNLISMNNKDSIEALAKEVAKFKVDPPAGGAGGTAWPPVVS
jgi:methyl-accepting chemotaxis protein